MRKSPSHRFAPSLLFAFTVTLSPAGGEAAELAGLPPGAEAAAGRITSATLAAPIRYLASDLLEGRGPGSRGDQLARAFLASELERMGYLPGATDGGYQQRFEMVGMKLAAPAEWRFEDAGGRGETLRWSDDWIAGADTQAPHGEIRGAELVFVGYGIQAPEYQWDDYKGANLKGKVLVMLNNDPDWDPKLFEGNRRLYYGRWTYKYESAARQGALAAILVHTTPSAGYPWQVVQTSWGGEEFQLPADPAEPRLALAAWATEEASRRLAALGGRSLDELVAAARRRDFRPVPLGVTTSLSFDTTMRRIETANVLGLLPGSDPKLREEVVVYSAHHDHFGVGAPDKNGDAIYNGAIDNASGCAQLLSIAAAYAALPEKPRRSILFAFVAAEEQGLRGSEYFARHPTFPAGKIAANVNFDAGNVFGRTKDVSYIGFGKSSLDALVERLAALQGRSVHGDALPDRGSFYRSDQFNFAKIGVPALYLDSGTEYRDGTKNGIQLQERYEATCYHQPCDQIHADWDYSGMVEDTQLGFYAGLAIADADQAPTWNAGDEFEAARRAALAAVK